MPYISVKHSIKSLKSLPNTHTLDPLDIDGYLLRLVHTTLSPVLTHIQSFLKNWRGTFRLEIGKNNPNL